MEPILPLDLRAAFNTRPQPLDCILPGYLKGSTGSLIAPGGMGKSMWLMQTALSLSIGRDAWQIWGGERLQPRRVVILALEDPPEVLWIRLFQLAGYLDEAEQALAAENLEILPLYGRGFRVAEKKGRELITPTDAWQAVVDYIAEGDVGLVAIDTWARAIAGLDENSAADMGAALCLLEAGCRQSGASILIVHHTSKAASLNGFGGEQEAGRGSSVLTANVRWQCNLVGMSDKDAERRGICDEVRRHWVAMELPKVNYIAPRPMKWMRRGEGGVLCGWERVPEAAPKTAKGNRRREWDDDEA